MIRKCDDGLDVKVLERQNIARSVHNYRGDTIHFYIIHLMEEMPLGLLRIFASSLPRSFLLTTTLLHDTKVHSSDNRLSKPRRRRNLPTFC
jgi:hypothetical protein